MILNFHAKIYISSVCFKYLNGAKNDLKSGKSQFTNFFCLFTEKLRAARMKEKADESKLVKAMTVNQTSPRLPIPEPQIQPRRQPRNRRRKIRKNQRQRRKQNDLKKFQWRRAFRKFWKWLKQTQLGKKKKNRRNRKQNRRNRFRRPSNNEKYDEEEARFLFETTFGALHEK